MDPVVVGVPAVFAEPCFVDRLFLVPPDPWAGDVVLEPCRGITAPCPGLPEMLVGDGDGEVWGNMGTFMATVTATALTTIAAAAVAPASIQLA